MNHPDTLRPPAPSAAPATSTPAPTGGRLGSWPDETPWAWRAVLCVVPVLATAVSVSTAWRFSVTVGDTAWLTQRVADAASGRWPLVGMPSSIGRGALDTHHPGPVQFYWLAPWWRLLGFRGIVVGTAAGSALALVALGSVVRRLPGSGPATAIGAQLAAAGAILTIGPETLADPWNPYAALAPAAAALVGLVAVLSGERAGWAALMVWGSVVTQLHVGFLPWTAALVVVAVVAAVRRPEARPEGAAALRWGALVGLLWLPPLVDAFGDGNVWELWRAAFRGGPVAVGWGPVVVAGAAALHPWHQPFDGPWLPPDPTTAEVAGLVAAFAAIAVARLVAPAGHWSRRWLEACLGAALLWAALATRALPFQGLLPSPYTRSLWPIGALCWFGVVGALWARVPPGRWRSPALPVAVALLWAATLPRGYVGIDPATRLRAEDFAAAVGTLDPNARVVVTARNFLAGWWVAPTVTAALDRRGIVNGVGTDRRWDVASMTERPRPLDPADCLLVLDDHRSAAAAAPGAVDIAAPSERADRAERDRLGRELVARLGEVRPSRLARYRAERGDEHGWWDVPLDQLVADGRFSDLVIDGMLADATLRDDEVARFVELDHLLDPDWAKLGMWATGC